MSAEMTARNVSTRFDSARRAELLAITPRPAASMNDDRGAVEHDVLVALIDERAQHCAERGCRHHIDVAAAASTT